MCPCWNKGVLVEGSVSLWKALGFHKLTAAQTFPFLLPLDHDVKFFFVVVVNVLS